MKISDILRNAATQPKVRQAADPTTAQELQQALEAIVKKHFPKSMVKTKLDMGFGHPAVVLYFTVAGSTNELINQITHNDISYTILFIYGVEKDGKVGAQLELRPTMGGSVLSKPEPGSHMAYDKIRVGLAKKKGTAAQILKHVDSYFGKLKQTIKSNLNKIPEDHLALIKHNL